MTSDQLSLDFGGVDFWTDRQVSELIAEAGAEPVENPADLELQGVSDEAWTALYEVLGSGRWLVARSCPHFCHPSIR